ncbi:hypothetical protein MMC34_008231 [Xylographa carneopallida]|nr:hypothetical protein [Xylographa carneopallida]
MVDAASPTEHAVLKEAAAAAPDRLEDVPVLPIPGLAAAQDAELAWQADRLQRQVSALQEEREAMAQHLDRMQEVLTVTRERGVADLRAAVEEGQMRMQGAVEGASEDVARHEREIADKRVVAAEKDILLQSQM